MIARLPRDTPVGMRRLAGVNYEEGVIIADNQVVRLMEGDTRYSWIDHGLQTGPTLAFLLWPSDFKTKTSFGFLIKKSGVFLFIFSKSQKMSSYGRKRHVWRF